MGRKKKKSFGTNKIFLGIIAAAFIIGAAVYFGLRESAKISSAYQNAELKSQLASLEEQVASIIEKPTVLDATTTTFTSTSTSFSISTSTPTSTEPKLSSEEPEKEVNPCDSLNCDDRDGWVKSGPVFACQDGTKNCDCQKQVYHNYSCSKLKGKCVYSVSNTKVDKSNCKEPEPEPARPDFIILSPSLSPASPVNGDVVTLWATVKNQGTESPATSLTYVNIDGQKFGEFFTPGLASGESVVVTASLAWTATIGSHKFEFCADGAKALAESNEINNCTGITLTVLDRIPDLIIESIDIAPDPLAEGRIVSFGTVIKNQGGASAKPTIVLLQLDVDNDGDWDFSPGAASTGILAMNESENKIWRETSWVSTRGVHKIEVCADAASEPELRVEELNENNNCLTKVITVL